MWKILTAQNREIYYSLISRGIFLDEQKRYRKRTSGIEELLYINQHILNESKTRRKNLAIARIDYKKVYDMVNQNWILHYLKMYKMPEQVIQFIEKTIDSKRKKHSKGKDPKRHIPGRCTITITICDSHDATQPHP